MTRTYYAALDIDSLPPPPTAAEERRLFEDFRARRTAGRRDHLVRLYLRFALRAARKDLGRRPEHFRSRPGMSEDDAISAANLGLVEAIERFDPTMGRRFTTYAAFWIFKHLLQARYGAHLVGVTYTDKRLFGKLSRLVNHEGVDIDSAAKALGLTVPEAQRLLDLPHGRTENLHLCDEGGGGLRTGSPHAGIDGLVDDENPGAALERDETYRELFDGLADLPELTQRVVRELYLEGRSVQQVCDRTRLSLRAVEKIRDSGLAALRRRLES